MSATNSVEGRRLAYPQLAESLVASVNALASRTETAVLGGAWTVRPRLRVDDYDASLTLGISIGGSRQRARLDAAALETLLGGLVAAPVFKSLDKELQAAVLEGALAGPLAVLRQWLDAEVVLEDVLAADAVAGASGPAFALLFDICESGGVRCSVVLELSSPLPAATVETLARGTSRRDCGVVPIPVTFEFGTAEVSAADLECLSPGDIVLFDRCYLADEVLRVNVAGRVFRRGAVAYGGVTIASESGND
ncbi:MAG: FliM/FliN family flagellar motor switch protein [Gammaproteobacteria bacterium]|nr:FliM/FliN family flagellar motor switch protein [Gammaproteobacteria bacterium]